VHGDAIGTNNNGFKYFMNNHMLDAVYEEKDLGVFIILII